jgi:DnaK suppressor protein
MNRKDTLLNLGQSLINRRITLRKALDGDINLLKELNSSGDTIDAALDSVEHEITSQLLKIETNELIKVENAINRMNEGNFGVCECCEVDIPIARLNALPYTTKCIYCQRKMENDKTNELL